MTDAQQSPTPWWWPRLANDPEYLATFRKDMPETAEGMTDEDLAEYLGEGWKYADTWDHLGDAREEYEKLADAFLALVAENERLRKLVQSAFNEGVTSGMDEYRKFNGGVTWYDSKSCAALSETKGEDG